MLCNCLLCICVFIGAKVWGKVTKDLFIKNRTRSLVTLLLFLYEFLWISLYYESAVSEENCVNDWDFYRILGETYGVFLLLLLWAYSQVLAH